MMLVAATAFATAADHLVGNRDRLVGNRYQHAQAGHGYEQSEVERIQKRWPWLNESSARFHLLLTVSGRALSSDTIFLQSSTGVTPG
jgi:hypothetical protein